MTFPSSIKLIFSAFATSVAKADFPTPGVPQIKILGISGDSEAKNKTRATIFFVAIFVQLISMDAISLRDLHSQVKSMVTTIQETTEKLKVRQ